MEDIAANGYIIPNFSSIGLQALLDVNLDVAAVSEQIAQPNKQMWYSQSGAYNVCECVGCVCVLFLHSWCSYSIC